MARVALDWLSRRRQATTVESALILRAELLTGQGLVGATVGNAAHHHPNARRKSLLNRLQFTGSRGSSNPTGSRTTPSAHAMS